jgi:hypothetical protein
LRALQQLNNRLGQLESQQQQQLRSMPSAAPPPTWTTPPPDPNCPDPRCRSR